MLQPESTSARNNKKLQETRKTISWTVAYIPDYSSGAVGTLS